MFVCGEINNTMNVLAIDDATGQLRYVQSLPSVPPDYKEGPNHVGPGEIAVHPSGRAVYVSNRGHDSIAIYAFDEQSGTAEFLGNESSRGISPRCFKLDPTGTFLFAANETPGSLVRFRLNPDTLWPKPDGIPYGTASPSCIVFQPRNQ